MVYKKGDYNVICDASGFKCKASETVKQWNGLRVKKEFAEQRHPQDRTYAARDIQSVPDPRPDSTPTFVEIEETSFSPDSLANLAVWLDATVSTSISATASRVSQWADLSGNDNHAIQATGSLQPLYVALAINNKAAIQFRDDGTNRRLAITDNATLNYSTFNVFAVIRRYADIGTEIPFGKWSESSPSNQREHRFLINTNDTLSFTASQAGTSTNATAATGVALSQNTDYIIDALYDGASIQAAVNGGTQASASLAAMFNGTGNYYLSGRDGGSNPSGIYIGEFIFYTSVLSAANRTSVLEYLSEKWGVSI